VERRIIIIKGFSKTDQEKQLDIYYAEAYLSFFQLAAGGAYLKDELIFMIEPTSVDLKIVITEQRIDFGIIVYIGHGANQDDNQIFQLNEFEIIKPGQFTLNIGKQIIILESCRVLTANIETVDLADKIPKFEKGGIVRLALTKDQAREIYDSHIKRCGDGIMIWYACGLGNEAYNFIFSKTLLELAIDWHLDATRHCAILPVDELSRLTWVQTYITARDKLGLAQLPCSDGNINYPFAISKF
jgi:hypothetical protein